SPASRKPVALSRNEPFSMPVIQCLGALLGMTASSLSVATVMALSSSVTRAHGLAPGRPAGPGSALAPARSNAAAGNPARKTLRALMRRPCFNGTVLRRGDAQDGLREARRADKGRPTGPGGRNPNTGRRARLAPFLTLFSTRA